MSLRHAGAPDAAEKVRRVRRRLATGAQAVRRRAERRLGRFKLSADLLRRPSLPVSPADAAGDGPAAGTCGHGRGQCGRARGCCLVVGGRVGGWMDGLVSHNGRDGTCAPLKCTGSGILGLKVSPDDRENITVERVVVSCMTMVLLFILQ